MADRSTGPLPQGAADRVGFLLSQVGAFAASRFAERLSALSLTPGDVGILRLVSLTPGLSQRELATRLGVAPSRVVVLVDELEKKSLLLRRRSERDRRNYELELTEKGREVMRSMREIGAAHEEDLVGSLSDHERRTLTELLAKVAASHDLTPNVHPGYRSMGGGTRRTSA